MTKAMDKTKASKEQPFLKGYKLKEGIEITHLKDLPEKEFKYKEVTAEGEVERVLLVRGTEEFDSSDYTPLTEEQLSSTDNIELLNIEANIFKDYCDKCPINCKGESNRNAYCTRFCSIGQDLKKWGDHYLSLPRYRPQNEKRAKEYKLTITEYQKAKEIQALNMFQDFQLSLNSVIDNIKNKKSEDEDDVQQMKIELYPELKKAERARKRAEEKDKGNKNPSGKRGRPRLSKEEKEERALKRRVKNATKYSKSSKPPKSGVESLSPILQVRNQEIPDNTFKIKEFTTMQQKQQINK